MSTEPGGSEGVLIVDDEASILDLLSQILKEYGYRVRAARDAEAALRELASASFAVLVTDIRMPGMHGVALAERARAVDPDIGVVFISGYDDGLADPFVRERRRAVFLRKPMDIESLLRAVHKVHKCAPID